jgi:hypothetical protein
MKANKIVAKLEARHHQFKLDSESKERTIKQKLERLNSYQVNITFNLMCIALVAAY